MHGMTSRDSGEMADLFPYLSVPDCYLDVDIKTELSVGELA